MSHRSGQTSDVDACVPRGTASDPFFTHSPTASAVLGLDVRIHRTNAAWDELLDRAVVGTSFALAIEPADRAAFEAAVRSLQERRSARLPLVLTGPGGPLEATCDLWSTEDADVFYCTLRPAVVTARSELLEHLLPSFDTADLVGVCVIDNELQRAVYANPAAARIWDMPDLVERAQAGTMSLEELRDGFNRALLDPEVAQSVRRELQAADGRREFEVLLRGNRAVLWVVVPAKDAKGRSIGTIALSHDITARKQTESQLERALARVAQSEKEFRTLLEVFPDGVSVIHNGVITYVNAAAARAYGVERPEDLVGVHVSAFVGPERLADTLARLDRMGRGVEPARVESFLRRDGSRGYLLSQGFPIESEGTRAVLTIGRDITEQRHLEAKMRQADRLASLGTLSATVAHEINNPLAYILLNLHATRRWLAQSLEEAPTPAATRTLDLIDQSLEGVDRVRKIVRDLRAFSHADDSQVELLDVRAVMESVIPMVEREIRSRAKLVQSIEEGPFVRANGARLGQVFVNLLVNAVQAIPSGEEGHEISVATSTEGRSVIVTVRDTGVGMSPAVRERIFEPFFTTKPPEVGTGLGLSVCLGIVHALGGEITVESAPGSGSTFRLSLPAAQDPPAVTRPEGPALDGKKARILVVDDEPRIASRLSELLQAHDVVIATNGTDALARMAETSFDAVFCDLMMPNVKGTDVFEAVVREQPHLHRRFIFMTAGAYTPAARELLDRVPNPRLDKPFTEAQVRHALALVLAGPR